MKIRTTLAKFTRQDWGWAGLLLALQLFSVVYQTAMAQEFAASVTRFRAGLHIVLGLVHILYAAGMYLSYRLFRGEFRRVRFGVILGLTGAAVLSSLYFCLRLNVQAGEEWRVHLPAVVAAIAASLTLFGMLYSALLTLFHGRHREAMGILVAVSLAGLVLGFAAAPVLTIHVGNNLLIAAIGVICVLLAFGRPGAVLATAVAIAALLFPRLDAELEKLRGTEGRFAAHSYEQYLTRDEVPNLKPILEGWSPYAKINLFELPGTPKLAGVYNYYITWIFDRRPDARRQQIYGFVRPDDRVLMLAIGGGWPLMALPTKDKAHVVGVELDPVVVDFFQKNPRFNDGLFNKIDLVRAEGRAALDTLTGPFDTVIVDLPGSPASPKENPIEFENFLLTREAIDRALALLSPDGVLVLYLLPHQTGAGYATVKASGVPWRIVYAPVFDRSQPLGNPLVNEAYAIFASRNGARVNALVDGILAASPAGGERIVPVPPEMLAEFEKYDVATDDLPYNQLRAWGRNQFARMSKSFETVLTVVGGAVLAVLLLALGIVGFGARRVARRLDLLYFLFIGVGFVMLQLYLYARMRSYFGDPIRTVLLSTLLLFAASGVGSLLAPRVEALRGRFAPLWGLGVVVLVGFTHVALGALPFGSTSLALKFLAAAAAIVPLGLVTGVFFPLGLIRLDRAALGWGLTLDGAGTFLGFVLFYLTAWYYGIASSLLPIAVVYGLAAVIAGRSAPEPASATEGAAATDGPGVAAPPAT